MAPTSMSSRGLAAVCMLLCLAAAGATGAEASTCTSPDSKGCVAAKAISGEQDGSLGLLQHGARAADVRHAATGRVVHAAGKARRRYMPNTTAVWEQIKGAVEISELREQLQNATDSVSVDTLQAQLTKLQAQFPSADEVQKEFSKQWANLTAVVNLDNVQQQLEAARAAGSGQLQELQRQFDAMSAQFPNISMDSVRDQTANLWANLQDAGLPLPSLDNLTAQVSDYAGQAADAVSDMASSASDAISGAIGNLSDTLGSWWR